MPGIDYAFIDSVLEQHGYDRTRIIAIMQDIQKQYRYLPREVIVYIGEKLHMTPAKLYGVATFYKNFSLDPKGKYVIKVCDGVPCPQIGGYPAGVLRQHRHDAGRQHVL